MGLRSINNSKSSFEDPYTSTGTEAWGPPPLPPLPYFGDRAIFVGGYSIHAPSGNAMEEISYFAIPTTGNATDFGNLSEKRTQAAAFAGDGRGCCAGGDTSAMYVNIIDYITIANTGNATDFGDLTIAVDNCSGTSSGRRGIRACGYTDAPVNSIDYVTIATPGNAIDFGDSTTTDVTDGKIYGPGAVSNGTLGLIGGGRQGGTRINAVQYITFETPSNAVDFGSLTQARFCTGAASNSTTGLWAGGFTASNYVNTIDYMVIATTGNCSDFGDLTDNPSYPGATANDTRFIRYSGYKGSNTYSNSIDYVTIATPGNATDFGDPLPSQGVESPAGCSGD